MRICIVGDQHFRFQLPYSTALSDGRRSEWEAVIKKIQETAAGCDAVVLMGDNLNTRHNHSSVNAAFVDFLNDFGEKPIFIMAGNHERYGEETAIDFLENVKPNWKVKKRLAVDYLEVGDEKLKLSFIPYMTPGSLHVEGLEEAQQRVNTSTIHSNDFDLPQVLFVHHAIAGTKIAGTTTEHLNEIVIPREDMEAKYKWIFGGHIHDPQRLSPKTLVVGNIFTHELGEHGKSVFVLDTKKEEVEEVMLPVRGIYKVELSRSIEDRDLTEIPDNSIVKCIVTDRQLDIKKVKEALSRFDAYIVVEQYPNERTKISLDDTGGLDLSIENLLKVYSEVREIPYEDLTAGMQLLTHNENNGH